jgi:polysaccharide pyruvyl transferase WcaK-like protein
MGIKGHLISCSFNPSPPESVRRAARKMLCETRVHARDAYSAERLSALLKRPVSHSADVAFGLLPECTDHSLQIVNWIRSQESFGRRVIALNVNLLPITMQLAGRENEYVRQWGQWLKELTGQKLSFVFLPHDYRGEWSDEVALASLFERALPDTRCCCFLPNARLHAAEIKYVVSNCFLVVTGRMHLAIASMGAGVPVIAYAYQSKFEGTLRLFGIESCVRPILGIFKCVGDEVAFALEVANKVERLRSLVHSHSDEVLALARRNIVHG